MANFIIKPTSSNDSIKFQGSDGSAQFTIAGTAGSLGSGIAYPAGHVIQTKSSFYSSTNIACGTTATTISQGELSNFTPKLVTSGKLLVWWWMSGGYTATASSGVSIGLKYSTNNFSSEATFGPSEWMAAYVTYAPGGNHKASSSASTGVITTPTASEFDVRFHVKTNTGTVYINQDGALDTMGIIIQEISV
jgi:hypothetical protein